MIQFLFLWLFLLVLVVLFQPLFLSDWLIDYVIVGLIDWFHWLLDWIGLDWIGFDWVGPPSHSKACIESRKYLDDKIRHCIDCRTVRIQEGMSRTSRCHRSCSSWDLEERCICCCSPRIAPERFVWLIDWLFQWLFEWLIDLLLLFERLIELFIDYYCFCLIMASKPFLNLASCHLSHLIDWLTVWLIDWLRVLWIV